jgi:hypothetical protein
MTWIPTPENYDTVGAPSTQSHTPLSPMYRLSAGFRQIVDSQARPRLRSALLAILDDHSGFPRSRASHHPFSSPLSCDRWHNAALALALEIL